MFWTTLTTSMRRRLRRRRKPPSLDGVLSSRQLHQLLCRERARADRTGDPLALITFTPREPEAAGVTWNTLAPLMLGRLRCTDTVGWYDRQSLAGLLPITSSAGAWKVVDDILLAYPTHISLPRCTVYCYPTSRGDGAATMDEYEAVASEVPRSAAKPVQPAEVLFVKPLPLWKRAIDVCGALAGLTVLFPILLLIAFAIKLTSRGPVMFRQRRSGLGGVPFTIYKFRTMVNGADLQKAHLMQLNEQDGPAFKIKKDPRVSRVGRFLRRTSLDELPQLWNVLRGEMSLVGPRPLPCDESDRCEVWQRRRLDVTPGLTCIWQVRGRSTVTFCEWVRMDIEYLGSRSLVNDVKLITQTVPAMALRRGAY